MDKIEEILNRGVVNIIPDKKKLEYLLTSGKKLNIFLGIDPTATKIHLGHAFPLRKLQTFCELGHNVTFLIGDFTTLIGDTSDKDSERPVLTTAQIEENFKTYKKQAEKILDFTKVNVVYNSKWLKNLSFAEIVKLCEHFSAGDFVGRELIKKRLSEGKKVGLHELLYPVMQGYDSWFLDTDIQLGGTDQTFNMQAGRVLQKDLRGKESYIIANSFLTGTDGRKMSKSWGNAVWLEDTPNDMYGKIMSVKDDLIIEYYTLGTNVSLDEVDEIEKELKDGANPMLLKKRLAFEVVSELYDQNQATEAQSFFEKTIQKSETPDDLPFITLPPGTTITQALVESKLADSNSQARRLIEQKGVRINDQTVTDAQKVLMPDSIINVGSRNYVKIIISG